MNRFFYRERCCCSWDRANLCTGNVKYGMEWYVVLDSRPRSARLRRTSRL